MRQSGALLRVGGLMVAAGAATWTLTLVFPPFGRNVAEALVMAVFGVVTPAIGSVVVGAELFQRYRSAGRD